jgi:hypothetical protein
MQPQKVTELTLDSGIRVFVTPLSRYQRNALIEAAEKLHPFPDKKQYEEALPDDVAIPGMTLPAEENPEYQAKVTEANRLRNEYVSTGMMNLCVQYPDFADRLALIEHFAPYLDEQRDWLALPDDEWLATLRFAIIRSPSDEAQILSVARDEIPVTEKEVNDNVRIFRPVLPKDKYRNLDYARKLASGTEGKVPDNE